MQINGANNDQLTSHKGERPTRRWYQYSLRTLFIVVTVICILVGTVVKQVVIPVERQRAAVEKIKELGGFVEYSKIPDDEPWLRQTMRKWLPNDYFDATQKLWLQGSKASDADLEFLEDLSQLKLLCFNHTQVTDAGLVHLTGLMHLTWLSLEYTQVTDAQVAKLKEALPNCLIVH